MKGLQKAIASIKESGFGYIKFELEGQIGRRNGGQCPNCRGNGRSECNNCQGEGIVPIEGTLFNDSHDCPTCLGDGQQRCSMCDGSGTNQYSNENVCHRFILDYVLKKAYNSSYAELRGNNPITAEVHDQYSARRIRSDDFEQFHGMPGLTFGRFYYDGSVDSEYTFTVPIEEVDKVHYYVEAFHELSKVAGNGRMDTSGAGMHIAVLPTQSQGQYPSNYQMPSTKLNNFRTEMAKLLPALYFLAAAGHNTRGMEYRYPRISSSSKYSAVYIYDRKCIEYRVFETCYQRPEAVYDFVQVIAASLKFYADPQLKVKNLAKNFGFVNTRSIAGYYDTPEQLRILNATVKWLKPEDKSLAKLKSERGIKFDIKSLTAKEKQKVISLRREYETYKKHHKRVTERPVSASERRDIDYYMLHENMTPKQAHNYVVRNRQRRCVTFSKFLSDNLKPKNVTTSVAV